MMFKSTQRLRFQAFFFTILMILLVHAYISYRRLYVLDSFNRWESLQAHQNDKTRLSSNDSDYKRENATFVSLARNSDIYSIAQSIQDVESRFNNKYHYDWVFFNDEPFTPEFIDYTSHLVSGRAFYETVPKEFWSYPKHINQTKAAEQRDAMVQKKIIYADSESYRHMCRFESGFFWQMPIMDNYRYYWRVEPDIHIYCDIEEDLFKVMAENQYKYGFTIAMYEFFETIPTLWTATMDFVKANPKYVHENNLLDFISDDHGKSYNLCHFWSNFEIADLDFWRSPEYREYFDHLDKQGGFFYERWGDAPVHSLAAALFLNRTEVKYFGQVGYSHPPYTNCPTDRGFHNSHRCTCNPGNSFTFEGYSCASKYFKVQGIDGNSYASYL